MVLQQLYKMSGVVAWGEGGLSLGKGCKCLAIVLLYIPETKKKPKKPKTKIIDCNCVLYKFFFGESRGNLKEIGILQSFSY